MQECSSCSQKCPYRIGQQVTMHARGPKELGDPEPPFDSKDPLATLRWIPIAIYVVSDTALWPEQLGLGEGTMMSKYECLMYIRPTRRGDVLAVERNQVTDELTMLFRSHAISSEKLWGKFDLLELRSILTRVKKS